MRAIELRLHGMWDSTLHGLRASMTSLPADRRRKVRSLAEAPWFVQLHDKMVLMPVGRQASWATGDPSSDGRSDLISTHEAGAQPARHGDRRRIDRDRTRLNAGARASTISVPSRSRPWQCYRWAQYLSEMNETSNGLTCAWKT
jgi:hypothetical protein